MVFAGAVRVFSTSKLQIVVGVTGQTFFCLMFNSICLPPFPRISQIHKLGKGAQIKKLATSIFKIIFSGACGLMSTGHNDLCDLMIATWYFQHQPVRLLGSG
jgi:hypothetical protein